MQQISISRQSGEQDTLIAIKLTREEYQAVKQLLERHQDAAVLEEPGIGQLLWHTGGAIGAVPSLYSGMFSLDVLSALLSLVSVGDVVTVLTASLSLATGICNLVGALHKKKGKSSSTRVTFTSGGETYEVVGDNAEEVAKLLDQLPIEEKKPKTPLF